MTGIKPSTNTYCSMSRGIAGNPEIEGMMGDKIRHVRFGFQVKATDSMLTWGKKHKLYDRSASIASKKNIPLLHLEDGFLCFIDPPSRGGKRHSLIVDDIGIYYDATHPSRLEKIISESDSLDAAVLERADKIRKDIVSKRVSKYNHQGFSISQTLEKKISNSKGQKVLVVDQTKNDASIKYGMASEESFTKMLEEAITKNPNATIFVKIHPDIRLGVKSGHFDPDSYQDKENLFFIDEDCNPHHLISLMDKVYVVTSQMGFEALMHKLPVHVYGMPFYAGWGLTDDRINCPRRINKNITLEQLISSALLSYPKYTPQSQASRPESALNVTIKSLSKTQL